MWKRVGSSGVVTVYLETMFSLSVYVLSCLRRTAHLKWRHQPWIESALLAEFSPDTIFAKTVRNAMCLKGYTHQEASLSQPPAQSTTTTVLASWPKSMDNTQTWSLCTIIHLLSSYTHTQFLVDSYSKRQQNTAVVKYVKIVLLL